MDDSYYHNNNNNKHNTNATTSSSRTTTNTYSNNATNVNVPGYNSNYASAYTAHSMQNNINASGNAQNMSGAPTRLTGMNFVQSLFCLDFLLLVVVLLMCV